MKKDLNVIVHAALYLILVYYIQIFRFAIPPLNISVIPLKVSTMPLGVSAKSIHDIVLPAFMIASIILMIKMKAIGYYLFLAVSTISPIWLKFISEDYLLNLLVSTILIVLISALLLLKKNNINGYQAFGIIKSYKNDCCN